MVGIYGCNYCRVEYNSGTVTGRVLSVLLAALGMMMFPIFTVYITNLIQQSNKRKKQYYAEEEEEKEKAVGQETPA